MPLLVLTDNWREQPNCNLQVCNTALNELVWSQIQAPRLKLPTKNNKYNLFWNNHSACFEDDYQWYFISFIFHQKFIDRKTGACSNQPEKKKMPVLNSVFRDLCFNKRKIKYLLIAAIRSFRHLWMTFPLSLTHENNLAPDYRYHCGVTAG